MIHIQALQQLSTDDLSFLMREVSATSLANLHEETHGIGLVVLNHRGV